MREKEIRWVIEVDDKIEKQAEAELKNKEKQKKTSSSQPALSTVDDQNSFCETGDADLVSALNLVTRR